MPKPLASTAASPKPAAAKKAAQTKGEAPSPGSRPARKSSTPKTATKATSKVGTLKATGRKATVKKAATKKTIAKKAAVDKAARERAVPKRAQTSKSAPRAEKPTGAVAVPPALPSTRSRRPRARGLPAGRVPARSAKAPEPVPSARKETVFAEPSPEPRPRPRALENPPAGEGASFALPSTYGESHVLLLARDPQTLFAAWDLAPSVSEDLKARIGRRAFAVSSLTLRLIPAQGEPGVFRVDRQDRSRYLKVSGASSFIAEIGYTTPAGRFQLAARSAPCFVPMKESAPARSGETATRLLVRYREASALARVGVNLGGVARAGSVRPVRGDATGRARPKAVPEPSSFPGPASALVLGGASDLYRR